MKIKLYTNPVKGPTDCCLQDPHFLIFHLTRPIFINEMNSKKTPEPLYAQIKTKVTHAGSEGYIQ